MATYQKTSKGHVCATVRIKGYPPKSRTFRTKAMARKWAISIEDAMRSGSYQDSPDGSLLGTIFDRYEREIVPLKKTVKFHRTNLKHLYQAFGHLQTYELSAQHIVRYVSMRREQVSSETVRKEVNTLGHVVKTAMALWGVEFDGTPVEQAKTILSVTRALATSKPRTRRLADGEEDKLFAALKRSPATSLAARLTLETARRLGEILAIKEELISRRNGRYYLQVEDSKTGAAFNVPLSSAASALLKTMKPDADGYLFTVRNDSISQAFGRAVSRAGLSNLRLTDLRHEALSRLFEAGFTVPEVMAISRHNSPDVLLKVYANVMAGQLGKKLDNINGGPTENV